MQKCSTFKHRLCLPSELNVIQVEKGLGFLDLNINLWNSAIPLFTKSVSLFFDIEGKAKLDEESIL